MIMQFKKKGSSEMIKQEDQTKQPKNLILIKSMDVSLLLNNISLYVQTYMFNSFR